MKLPILFVIPLISIFMYWENRITLYFFGSRAKSLK